MRTHTIEVGPEDKLVEIVNSYEGDGWSVRQIVPSTAYGYAYVVFERSDLPAEFAMVPAVVPLPTYRPPVPSVPVPVGAGAGG